MVGGSGTKTYLSRWKGEVELKPTFADGRGKWNSLSNLPGRLRAGSMASSLLVAPITTTSPGVIRVLNRESGGLII